jgi:8-oxo-dGTP diphosphatase
MPVEDQKADQTKYQIIPRVLIFAARGGRLLLIKGAPTKRLWPNLYNGIGGHIEPGETILEAAQREFFEETGLELVDPKLCAVITIDTRQPSGIGMFVFKGSTSEGDPIISVEGNPEWVDFHQINSVDLVEDLPELIPRVLEWKPEDPIIFGQYKYSSKNELEMTF